MFSPIAGVLIADYLLVKRMRIDLVALFETGGPYWYWKWVNPIAVTWTALGFLAYMFVIPPEYIRVLVTLLATGAGYWAMMQLLSPYSIWLARASHPGEQREPVQRSRLGARSALTLRWLSSPVARGRVLPVHPARRKAGTEIVSRPFADCR